MCGKFRDCSGTCFCFDAAMNVSGAASDSVGKCSRELVAVETMASDLCVVPLARYASGSHARFAQSDEIGTRGAISSCPDEAQSR